ncbi:Ig kappa chain V-I region Hau, partial [Fukomys damarensis]
LTLFQYKPGIASKLLIGFSTTLPSVVPSRFSGSGNGKYFTLNISSPQPEGAEIYDCLHNYNNPPTVI